MSNSLEISEKKSNDVRTRIVAFLNGERRVVLTSEEEKIMRRWQRANELFESGKYTWNDIRDSIVEEFAVSKWTAENDLSSSQEIFGRLRKVSKRYLIHQHLERLNRQIQLLHEAYFNTDEDGRILRPDAKELAAFAKLQESYTYTLNSIPDIEEKRELPPPVLVFKLADGVTLVKTMSREEAMKEADNLIEDIDHEDSSH